MKILYCLAAIVGVLLLSAPCFGQASSAPHQVGGFVLGDDIGKYSQKVVTSSAFPVRYAGYLTEVLIKDTPGFKTGLIYYGTCDAPDKIVRIRLKYADSSKAFYKALLDKVIKRFGKPTEWRGDPFGAVLAWKWALQREDGGRASMILQHNDLDADESKGNTIKLTLVSQLEKERACHQARHPEGEGGDRKEGKDAKKRAAGDWLLLVPR